MADIAVIQAQPLTELAGIRHGFFGRKGGVSEGLYASLNCGFGSGDDPALVAENRNRAAVAARLDPAGLVTAYQTHSILVATVERPWRREDSPKVDAMVTARKGIALGILAADCAPVLFADAKAHVAGAAHAGWRGALEGVLEATLARMTRLGAAPERIRAAVGPCIAQASYEVGPEFRERFLAVAAGNARFFRTSQTRPGHYHFDLPGYVADRLRRAGIGRVTATGGDSCGQAQDFFSYRRATLEGRKDYGRNLSIIALED
jgi:YfiH family protein